MSPLLANIALSVLDKHLQEPWKPGGPMSTGKRRHTRHVKGLPTWRIVRYADDFLVLVNGTRQDTETLRDQIAAVLTPLGLRLSTAKTQVVHLSEGVDFLGFHIQWRRKRGTAKWYVYTFVGKRPLRSVKAKVRALTRKTSQQHLGFVLHRLNSVLRGWAFYFRHAVAKGTFHALDNFTWWRLVHMLRTRHRWSWTEFRRRHTTPDGHWLPIAAGEVKLARISAIPVTRYRYRGSKIPTPWAAGTA